MSEDTSAPQEETSAPATPSETPNQTPAEAAPKEAEGEVPHTAR